MQMTRTQHPDQRDVSTDDVERGLDIGTPPVLREAEREVLHPRHDDERLPDRVPEHWRS